MTTPSPSRDTLPVSGYSRLSDLLPFLPIARTTVYKWMKQGRFPQPAKLGPCVTAWRNSDIHDWLNSLDHREASA